MQLKNNIGNSFYSNTIRAKRDSNMEFVRIIAMSMILIWHFLLRTGVTNYFPSTRYLLPLVNGGVDLFILISGYFLIKFNLKSIFRLIFFVVGFEITTLLASTIISGSQIDINRFIVSLIAPLSKSYYWFIRIYFSLVLLSPFLNLALEHLNISKLRSAIFFLSIIEFYGCWLLRSDIDFDGYGLFNMIYLYILSNYLRREPYIKCMATKSIVIIGLLALCINIIFHAIIISNDIPYFSNNFGGMYHKHSLRYNNPLTIIFCTSIILYMSRVHWSSTFINSIASCALGVYLIQEGYTRTFLYNIISKYAIQHNIECTIISIFIEFILLWIVSWIISTIINFVLYAFTHIKEALANIMSAH